MVYLFIGPELGEKEDAINTIREEMTKRLGVIEVSTFYATETEPDEYVALLENSSFFSSGTLVIVKNCEALKGKDNIALIGQVAKAKDADNVLVLTSDEMRVDAALEKALETAPPGAKKVFWAMNEARLAPYIKSLFAKEKRKIDEDAVQAMVDMCEANSMALRKACQRLFIVFDAAHVVTSEDIDAVLTNSKDESAFDIFSALCDVKRSPTERLEASLSTLQKLRLSKDNSSVMIIAALTACFRKVLAYKAGTIAGYLSKKQKAQYEAALKLWSVSDIERILATLSATDAECRAGGALGEETLLVTMIYALITNPSGASVLSLSFEAMST